MPTTITMFWILEVKKIEGDRFKATSCRELKCGVGRERILCNGALEN